MVRYCYVWFMLLFVVGLPVLLVFVPTLSLKKPRAGLSLMDRYPWVQLSPVYVHPAFVERVKDALEERVANVDASTAEDVREKWERGFERCAPQTRHR